MTAGNVPPKATILRGNTPQRHPCGSCGHQAAQRQTTGTKFSEIIESFKVEVQRIREVRCKKPKEVDSYQLYLDKNEVWDIVKRIGQSTSSEGDLEAEVCYTFFL